MPDPKAKAGPDPHETEASIKARKQLLFGRDPVRGDVAAGPRKSFAELLRETPAAPLSTPTKALLIALALLVAGLFIATLVVCLALPRKKPRGERPPTSFHRAIDAGRGRGFTAEDAEVAERKISQFL